MSREIRPHKMTLGRSMTRSQRLELFRRWAPHLGAGILLAVLLVWDRPVYEAIHGFRNPFLDVLTQQVSRLRGAAFPVVIGLILLVWGILRSRARIWRAGAAMLLTAAMVGGLVAVLKPTFARPGPAGPWTPKPGESWVSARYGRFPSSHAALLFGTATALTAFLPATAPVGYTIATLVCHERLYDGTHLPSDILAGAWLGIAVASFVVGRLARFESWKMAQAAPFVERRAARRAARRRWGEKVGTEEAHGLPDSSPLAKIERRAG
jgi:membrane-associated phospholipid phosphatase